MNPQTKIVPVELSDGTIVKIEATPIGEQQVAYRKRPFGDALSVIKSITYDIASALQSMRQEVKPDKISIKLGLEIAVESGQLTALVVKGASTANFEVTMEWESRNTTNPS